MEMNKSGLKFHLIVNKNELIMFRNLPLIQPQNVHYWVTHLMGSNYKAEIILLKELSNYITTKCIRYTSVILSPANDILKEDVDMVIWAKSTANSFVGDVSDHWINNELAISWKISI